MACQQTQKKTTVVDDDDDCDRLATDIRQTLKKNYKRQTDAHFIDSESVDYYIFDIQIYRHLL